MENQNSFSRRVAIKSSIFGVLALPLNNILYAKNITDLKSSRELKIVDVNRYPAIAEDIVAEVVGVSHFNLDRLKELVDKRPELARATWDWGFGDWETTIGAASHVGRKDIVEYLISKGARPDIFTFAMLGAYDTVKSMIELMPGLQRTRGPHGISLMQHAKEGDDGSKGSVKLIEYLMAFGDADSPEYFEMDDAEKQKYVGDYKYGEGDMEGFSVKVTSRKALTLGKIGKFGGVLVKNDENIFEYRSAPSVKVSFQLEKGKIVSLTVKEPDLTLVARKI